jgi:hydrogenase small subunit
MPQLTRREFLTAGAKLAGLLALGPEAAGRIAAAVEQLAAGRAPVLWLQGQSCSGCSVSLLDSDQPGAAQVLTQYISLKFHAALSTATGQAAMDVLNGTVKRGGYILAVEGAIPVGMPEACEVGGESMVAQVIRAAGGAKAVLAVGTCAAFGGIPAAEGAPTGAVSVKKVLDAEGIRCPLILLPGCPVHPDWLVGTIAHLLKFGPPPLDDRGRPKAFYSRAVHEQCPRFSAYQEDRFAKTFGGDGCLFELGCRGQTTHADCPARQWNGGTNFCIRAGSPCIGCAAEDFSHGADDAFYHKAAGPKPETRKADG